VSEPRRIGEILDPALARLQGSEQGRAYHAWARATGAQVAGGARAKAFSRGVLTVECGSSVWASELTYLSDQIMRRMQEMAPDHPVKRLRFMVARSPVRQEAEPAEAKPVERREAPAPPDFSGARAAARSVNDERLRAAILAALQAPPEGSSPGPGTVAS
jgi:Dna[CI] antecedent, DciA